MCDKVGIFPKSPLFFLPMGAYFLSFVRDLILTLLQKRGQDL